MPMRTSIIAAIDQNNGIGYQNHLPWNLPAELRIFHKRTKGHHLIMGRKTYESIGNPLPDRITIVVTRNSDYQADRCLVAHSVPAALALAEANGEQEVFNCGGSGIYQDGLKFTDRLYISRIHAEFEVDTYFPKFDTSLWTESRAEFYPSDDENPHPFTFFIYDRRT